ncbi:uncharacterized protein ACA1_265360 [Acanthamoeba castellanii str. Neff]|uniref:Calcium-regulated actin-bundling protein C-terminal domain-containing protein n=1 Tax=Acanthamoeba castellanii (strain ATCC 30010 / Neff) TaxID=1257118 RepID=L8H4D6_ACACF|nr:uncharacterized protein ACA1_265360 [Acanthamoeba castellanii str. Neff]ELR19331.1 hypothetical protein ACA1_265360 [Acanthamoeba castellanii str. Neff]
MASLAGVSDREKLDALCQKTHKEQAVWFLNAFWETFAQAEAENVWKVVHKCFELDAAGKEGSQLDELQAHRLLEYCQDTHTVATLREKLRASGAIEGTPKKVPLTHILVTKHGVDWHALIHAPQGSREEVVKAEQMFSSVQALFASAAAKQAQSVEALAAASAAEAEAKSREDASKAAAAEAASREASAKASEAEARAKEAEAKAKEDDVLAVKAELEAALNDLKAQEAAHKAKTDELTRLSEEGNVVAKNKAKAELAQHLAQDPLALQKAKITQEVLVKKADKAAQVAKGATDEASRARASAEASANSASQSRAAADAAANQAAEATAAAQAARADSEKAKAAAEAAVEEANRKIAEADAYLDEARKRLPLGANWWMDRELTEAKAYLPKSKGGISKN